MKLCHRPPWLAPYRVKRRALLLVTALVVCVFAAAACASDDDPATDPPATVPAGSPASETTVSSVDGVAIVMDAIDAWNSGDFDAWLSFWDVSDDDHVFSRSLMNANERIEVTAPCEVVANETDRVSVACSVYVEDDFHGPGGLSSDGTMTYLLDGAGLILDSSSTTYEEDNGECCPRWEEYHEDFHAWLAAAHPDAYEQIDPRAHGHPTWWLPGAASDDAEDMKIALEYVAEFVAESSKYPLEDGVV